MVFKSITFFSYNNSVIRSNPKLISNTGDPKILPGA